MSKTIEEAMKEYVDEQLGLDYIGEVAVEQAFKASAQYILSLPLSEQLNEEEKKQLKDLYNRMELDAEYSDIYGCIPASDMYNAMEQLKRIFGKETFTI